MELEGIELLWVGGDGWWREGGLVDGVLKGGG